MVAVVLLGVIATLWVASRLRTLLFILFVSLFIAVALEPAVQFLGKRGWRRGMATSLVFGVTILLVVGFVAALIPVFVTQAAGLARSFPGYVESVQSWLAERDIDLDLIDPRIAGQFRDLGSLIQAYGSRLAGGVFAVGNTVFSVLFQMVTTALFSYYMVADGPKLRRTLLSFLPPERQREAMRIWEIAVDRTGGYIYSRMVLAVVAAIFTAVVLSVLRLPYPVALGLWVGTLSQFVPVIGTYIAAVLPVLVALANDPPDALWVLVALVGYQQVENFIVAPRITARAMSIHPAVSVGAVIAGASLLGGIGAVLALPVAATAQAVISTAARRHEVVAELEGSGQRRPKEAVNPIESDARRRNVEGIEGVGGTRVDG